MKIGIITFHASFNYGSMLQAYALHKVLSDMGHDVEIINFRSPQQKEMYHHPIMLSSPEWSKLHMLIHYIVHFREYIPQIRKWNRYNSFLKKYLVHTKEFHTVEELEKQDFQYDYLFIGSDQIWNINCRDFSEAYWGNFVNENTKKVAYAPSMGRLPESLDAKYIKDHLRIFHAVAVREERTKNVLIDNYVFKNVSITLDPTFLLNVSDYDAFAGTKPLLKGDYVFFYDPFVRPNNLLITLKIAKEMGYRVIVDRPYPKLSYQGFDNILFYTKVGPKEFLNLIKFSRFVIAHSLHAVIFSIIYKKDFYAIDGDKDSRMNFILDTFNLKKRAINVDNPSLGESISINYWDSVNERLEDLKKKSYLFINNALS